MFYARIAEENGWFDFAGIVDGIVNKLTIRHPHVFAAGHAADKPGMEDLHRAWEQRKQQDRAEKGVDGVLGDIPLALPALQRAHKIQARLARVGFDWNSAAEVLQQVRAELDELQDAVDQGDVTASADELGDVLFSCVNLARHLTVNPDTALRFANQKVSKRVAWMESALASAGQTWESSDMQALERLWQAAKSALRDPE